MPHLAHGIRQSGHNREDRLMHAACKESLRIQELNNENEPVCALGREFADLETQ
jgi:hypothetical protein